MVHIGYVYVPQPSKANLLIGLENNIWGWRSRALDNAGARDDLKTFKTGDYLVFGHHGPNTRTQGLQLWQEGSVRRVLVSKITKPWYLDVSPMWPNPDEIFPERVDLDFLLDVENVAGSVLGAEALERLKRSANTGGVVQIGGDAAVLERLGETPHQGIPEQNQNQNQNQDAEEDDRVLGIDGNLNSYAYALVRREQRLLRRMQCGTLEILSCHLCGRSLPRRMVRTAHIKKRSRCTPSEQRSLKNVMLACTTGCDEMFEHGYIYVDHVGVIRKSPLSAATDDLGALAHRLSGHPCAGFDGKQAYFRWHRENIAGVTAP